MIRGNTKALADILSEFIKEEGLSNGLQCARIFSTWDLVVGEGASKATSKKFFKDGVLFCTISSSIMRSQLYYRRDDIIYKINKMLNSQLIKSIVLR